MGLSSQEKQILNLSLLLFIYIVMNKTKLVSHLKEIIADTLKNKKNVETSGYGILGGTPGVLMFLTEYLKHYKDKEAQLLLNQIEEQLLDQMANNNLDPLPSKGAPGIIFSLWYKAIAEKQKFVENRDINNYLQQNAIFYANQNNWDLLHGFIGTSCSFFLHPKPLKFKKTFELLVDILDKTKLKSNFGFYNWDSTVGMERENRVFNTGLAHGFPPIIIFLCKVHQLGIKQKKVEALLKDAVDFCKTIYQPKNKKRFFPTSINIKKPYKQEYTGRNGAWCYGDFGIIIALLQTGKTLQDKELTKFAHTLALNTLNKEYEITAMRDAMLCHGKMGVAHIYNRFYQAFGDAKFKKAFEFYTNDSYKNYYKKGKGIGGFKKSSYEEETEKFFMEDSISLLDGSAGIGLTILSYLHPKTTGNWDLLFYTDIHSLKNKGSR